MKKIFFTVVFIVAVSALAYGAQKSRIELTDGSTVEGEIVSFSKDQYMVKSPSLGTLKIEDAKVRAIHKADAADVPSQKNDTSFEAGKIQSEVQKLEPAITGNPDIMKAIPGLLASPDFQDILNDSEIQKAAKSMDIKALMANEKFVKAANNPAVKEIGQKLKEKNG